MSRSTCSTADARLAVDLEDRDEVEPLATLVVPISGDK
jgi:hypothetical protein